MLISDSELNKLKCQYLYTQVKILIKVLSFVTLLSKKNGVNEGWRCRRGYSIFLFDLIFALSANSELVISKHCFKSSGHEHLQINVPVKCIPVQPEGFG